MPRLLVLGLLLLAPACASARSGAGDALPSWNDGPSKRAIVDFVARVTDADGPDFVPAAQRIATFDNDGTLWSEQPVYFQLASSRWTGSVSTGSAASRVEAETQPFKACAGRRLRGTFAADRRGGDLRAA